MAQPNEHGGPFSPERNNIHESDMNGIVALLQLSAGKKNNRKRRDMVNSSPSTFGSPGKRGRGYSPAGTSLSPSSRVMHMPPMSAMSPRQVGLQNLQGLQVPGVSGIPGMVPLADLPPWMKQAQKRMERATAPLPDPGTTAASIAAGRLQKSEVRVVSKRALQREGRREAKRHAMYRETIRGALQLDMTPKKAGMLGLASHGGPDVGGGGRALIDGDGSRGAGVYGGEIGSSTGADVFNADAGGGKAPADGAGSAGAASGKDSPYIDLRKDDKHGSLAAFICREFLYSDIDEAWYGEGREWMNGVLQDAGFDTTGDVMLTKAEWAALRSSMKGQGSVRRLSAKFMRDSRAELCLYRERKGDTSAFSVGQAVTAVHPGTLEIQDGVILTLAGANQCRVQFDRVELGVQLVPMSMLRKVNHKPVRVFPAASRMNPPSVSSAATLPPMSPASRGVMSRFPSQIPQQGHQISNGTQPVKEYLPDLGQQQLAPVAIPLSYMLTAFMQNSGMRTPETSPEKIPTHGLPTYQGLPGQSPAQLQGDIPRMKVEEDTKVALDFRFDEEAIQKMDTPEKQRYVLSELNKALRAACSKEDQDRIDLNVANMYAECAEEIDNIKEGQGMLGGTIRPVLDFGLDVEFQVGWRGHQRIRQELEGHVKQLMAMLMMLERTPSMFDVFLRGLDLLTTC